MLLKVTLNRSVRVSFFLILALYGIKCDSETDVKLSYALNTIAVTVGGLDYGFDIKDRRITIGTKTLRLAEEGATSLELDGQIYKYYERILDNDIYQLHVELPPGVQIPEKLTVSILDASKGSNLDRSVGDQVDISRESGKASFSVLSSEGAKQKTYELIFHSNPSNKAILEDLEIVYAQKTYQLKFEEEKSITEELLSGVGLGQKAVLKSYKVSQGAQIDKKEGLEYDLSEDGKFFITVTSEDRLVKETYEVNFLVAFVSDATLKTLNLTYKGKSYPVDSFDPVTKSAIIELDPNEDLNGKVVITQWSGSIGATIDRDKDVPYDLSDGGGFQIIMESQDKSESETYFLNFRRRLYNESRLEELSVLVNGNSYDVMFPTEDATIISSVPIVLTEGTDLSSGVDVKVTKLTLSTRASARTTNLRPVVLEGVYQLDRSNVLEIFVQSENARNVTTYEVKFTVAVYEGAEVTRLDLSYDNVDYSTQNTPGNNFIDLKESNGEIFLPPGTSLVQNVVVNRLEVSPGAAYSLALNHPITLEPGGVFPFTVTSQGGNKVQYVISFKVLLFSTANLSQVNVRYAGKDYSASFVDFQMVMIDGKGVFKGDISLDEGVASGQDVQITSIVSADHADYEVLNLAVDETLGQYSTTGNTGIQDGDLKIRITAQDGVTTQDFILRFSYSQTTANDITELELMINGINYQGHLDGNNKWRIIANWGEKSNIDAQVTRISYSPGATSNIKSGDILSFVSGSVVVAVISESMSRKEHEIRMDTRSNVVIEDSYNNSHQSNDALAIFGMGLRLDGTLFPDNSEVLVVTGVVPNTKISYSYSTISSGDLTSSPDGRLTFLKNHLIPQPMTGISGELKIRVADRQSGNDLTVASTSLSQIWDWKDLYGIRYDLDQSYMLASDIMMPNLGMEGMPSDGFKPIGTTSSPFRGNFDGKNRSISNIRILQESDDYAGIFGNIGSTSKEDPRPFIRDLTLNVEMIEGRDYVGALSGRVRNAYLKNIEVRGNAVKGRNYVGGVVGRYTDHGMVGSTPDEISFFVSNIQVRLMFVMSKQNYVGGAFGYVRNEDENNNEARTVLFTFERIQVMTTNVSAGGYSVGGLVGHAKGVTFLRSVYNKLDNLDSYSISGTRNVGGICGEASQSIYRTLKIESCYVIGNVKGSGTSSSGIGGIIGSIVSNSQSLNNNNDRFDLNNLYFNGNVGEASQSSEVGGLVGRIYEDDGKRIRFVDSHVNGMVSGRRWVGTVVGYVESSSSDNSDYSRIYSLGTVMLSGNRRHDFVGYGSNNYKSRFYADRNHYADQEVEGNEDIATFLNIADFQDSNLATNPTRSKNEMPFHYWNFKDTWRYRGPGQWPILRSIEALDGYSNN